MITLEQAKAKYPPGTRIQNTVDLWIKEIRQIYLSCDVIMVNADIQQVIRERFDPPVIIVTYPDIGYDLLETVEHFYKIISTPVTAFTHSVPKVAPKPECTCPRSHNLFAFGHLDGCPYGKHKTDE